MTLGPVFLAGPMFSEADKQQQNWLSDLLWLEAGIETFLAPRDGIEIANALAIAENPELLGCSREEALKVIDLARFATYALDIYQATVRCQACVLNLDGRVPDEGSVMEAQAAFDHGRPVVIYKTTNISLHGGFDSPLVQGLGPVVHTIPDLVAALKASKRHPPSGVGCHTTEQMGRVVAFGRMVWEDIDLVHKGINEASIDIARELVERWSVIERPEWWS